jgi:phospholipase C
MGHSAVDTHGEAYHDVPVGLGIRVPLLVVSPWTRGGWVHSQVFDHTSVLRLLETRFGVAEPNISPWRRAVTGDLTSVFDFSDPDRAALFALPDVSDYKERTAAIAKLPDPKPPLHEQMPRQEPGQRPARALPYDLHVHAETIHDSGALRLRFVNAGSAAAVFNVYAPGSEAGPWYYTVLPGGELEDVPHGLPTEGAYALAVHGPNGFLRELSGDRRQKNSNAAAQPWLEARSEHGTLVIALGNRGSAPCTLQVRALDYGDPAPHEVTLAVGGRTEFRYDPVASDHWYDLQVASSDGAFRRRLAGHLETGRASRSDPALGRSRS